MSEAIHFLKKNKILLFISLIIFLIVASSTTAFYSRLSATRHQQKKDALLKIRATLDGIWNHVNIADMGFLGYVIVPEEKFLVPYNNAVAGYQTHLDSLSQYLTEQYYPNEELVKANAKSIEGYIELIGHMVDLVNQDRQEEAVAIFKSDPGYDVWVTFDKFSKDVLAYVGQLEAEAQERYDNVQLYTALVQGLLLFVGVPILLFTIARLQRDRKSRRQLLRQLDSSNRKYIFDEGSTGETKDESTVIGHLIANLEKATVFIKQITQGNYTAHWEGLTEEHQQGNQRNLAVALVQMREQMKQVKQEDEQRLWQTQGEGQVAEIARTHQTDLTALGDQLLSYIIPYLHANQGGLFIVNEADSSEPYLEMVACYAYDKKKHKEKQIKLGQGLVGQAFIEQKTICLNQIPEDYVQITSGLGEATPSYLAIIPLKFNEEVLGVLEIASFQALNDFEVEFLERTGEIIASSISIIRTSERTQHLLDQSREQTEEMQAQEEEMRQNLEELVATQEAASRSQQKVQAIFDSATDGIVMLTAQGHVEMFNPAAEVMFGYSADEILNQSFENLFVPLFNDQESDQPEVALAVGQLQTIEAKRKDGEVFQAELRMQESEVGSQKMLIGLIRDLTQDERQKANQKLMRERIQEIEAKAYDRLVKLREKFKGQLAERDQLIEELKANSSFNS